MASLLAITMPKHRVMQGHVDEKLPTFFWVACCAEKPTPEQEKERETWRHCLAWRIKQETAANIHLDPQLTPEDMVLRTWQSGTLHLLTAAPRTGGGRARVTFEPAAEEFGPTLMFVMDYIGPLVSVFGCLHQGLRNLGPMHWPATGPVRAALVWERGLVTSDGPHPTAKPFNALSKAIPPDFLENLPKALTCIDKEQAAVIGAIRASDAPLHLVHALAGTGKSMVIQALLAHWVSNTRVANRFLLVTLRNRPLRHEFLETLLENKVLEPQDVLFAGKLPDWLIERGVTDNDEAHFEKQILKLPQVAKAKTKADDFKLYTEEAHRAYQHAFCRRHPNFEQAYHDALPRARGIKILSQRALQELWEYFRLFAAGAEETLMKVSVLLATTDVALKLYASLATPSSPAARLLKHQEAHAILMDEIQRVPTETFLGLAMHTPTLCAFGDQAQKVIINSNPSFAAERNSLVQRNILIAAGSGPTLAIDHLLRAVPGTPSPHELMVHKLTHTKRFGEPLATYLAELFPKLCKELKASPELGKETQVQHIWYRASPNLFWVLQDIKPQASVPEFRANKRKGQPVDADNEDHWRAYGIVWHSPLFTTLALHILYQLDAEASERRDRGEAFKENELVVVVGACLRRMLGPFNYLMNQLLAEDSPVRGSFFLEGVKACHVQCRVPGELTGPSAKYAYVLRHPRYRHMHRWRGWAVGDLQSYGTQVEPMANYIMMSRPEKKLVVLLHDTPNMEQGDADEIKAFKEVEELPAFGKERILCTGVDFNARPCETQTWPTYTIHGGHIGREFPLAGDGLNLWRERVLKLHPWVDAMINEQCHRKKITTATNLEPKGERVMQHLQGLPLTNLLGMTRHEAQSLGRAQGVLASPLGDLGLNTWPRADHEVLNSIWNKRKVTEELEELCFRLVNHVAVQLTGQTACQIVVPLLNPIWPYYTLSYVVGNAGWCKEGQETTESMFPLQVFALLVLAIYKRHYGLGAVDYHIMHVHHKTKAIEHEEQTYFSRSCNAEREAVVFIDPTTARELQEERQAGRRRARKPQKPAFYLYIGGGCFGEPSCITSFVIRTKDLGLAAAVTAGVRKLGDLDRDGLPVQVTEDLIMGDASSPGGAKTQAELMERMKSMWANVCSLDILELFAEMTKGHPDWDPSTHPAPGTWCIRPVPVPRPPGIAPPAPGTWYTPPAPNLPIDLEDPEALDWSPPEEEEERLGGPEDPATHAAVPGTPDIWPRHSDSPLKVGVGLEGVLLPMATYAERQHMTKGSDFVPIGFVPGADIWVRDLAAYIKPENLYVISCANKRFQQVYSDFVFTHLFEPAGVPRENIVLAAKTTGYAGKGEHFVRLGLNCWVDDSSDDLQDVAKAAWKRDPYKPPKLFLVPTRYHEPWPTTHGSDLVAQLKNCQYQLDCWPRRWGFEWQPFIVESLDEVLRLLLL